MIAFLACLVALLARLFGERTYVYFNQSYFELERQTLSVTYGREKFDMRDIVGVFLQKEGEVYQVNIRSYYMTYRLGGALGENESAWLVQEIQDWLNAR